MFPKKRIVFTIVMFSCIHSGLAQVPAPRFIKPGIPYFMESMDFQSVRMRVFGTHYSGLVDDKYSDLNWNPAFINQIEKKYFYIDFSQPNSSPIIHTPLVSSNSYTDNYFVRSSWYSSTISNEVDNTPHYNAAILFPLLKDYKIAVFHRLIFDYGPLLSQYGYSEPTGFPPVSTTALKRLEADENQQTIVGSQTQVIIGTNLFSKLDIGLRFGHYLYRQDGEIYDSQWNYLLHQSSADLNENNLEVNADQYETGLGGLYHLTDNIKIGGYIGLTMGDGDRVTTVSDTSESWSERDTDSLYYSYSHSYVTSKSNSAIESDRPKFTLMFEWKLKDALKLRSSFSYIQLNSDFSGDIAASDTSNGDRTYDYYVNPGVYILRRTQSESFGYSSLIGTGEESSKIMNWYISLIYQPRPEWTLFGGIQIQKQNYHFQVDELSTNKTGSFTISSLYDPETGKSYYFDDKQYTVKSDRNLIIGSIPIGLFAQVYKGFSLIFGTDLMISLLEDESSSDLIFITKLKQEWDNGNLVVNDLEENRLERFTSKNPKLFAKTTNTYFGFMYQHTSGINLYAKSSGELFSLDNWGFGLELEL